jgi:hypothetical protein
MENEEVNIKKKGRKPFIIEKYGSYEAYKIEYNKKPEQIIKRRLNSRKSYEKKKLNDYILKNGNDNGFNYVYLKKPSK